MRRIGFLVLTLTALCAASAGAQGNGSPSGAPTPAPPLPVDGAWNTFSWLGGPDVLNNEGAFTFTGPAVLDVTDAFIDGDQFSVLDFGVSIGTTSAPTDTGSFIGDFDAAFADAGWSSGSFALGAGNHSITIRTIAVATGFPDGGAALRATPTMPATPPWALTLLALAAVGTAYLFLRRRAVG